MIYKYISITFLTSFLLIGSSQSHATEWGFTDSTSSFTGERIVALYSEDTAFGSGLAVIRIKCRQGNLEFQISTSVFLSTNTIDVKMRLDENEVETYELETSSRFQDAGLWNDVDARPFIKRLLKTNRLRTQITPFSKNPHYADFDLTGSKEFFTEVYPCNS